MSQVVAVVVVYHPDAAVADHLALLRRQVETVIVVDNSEDDSARRRFAELAGVEGLEFVFNGRNEGIGRALNQGAERALALGAAWIATFDQDSAVPEGYIAGMLAAGQRQEVGAPVAILAPLYRDRRLGLIYSPSERVTPGDPPEATIRVTVTSGNLVAASAWRALGGFREDLFIDCVDFDFCLRARRAGWRLVEVRSVVLEHQQGSARRRPWLWKNPVVRDYGATRRYYQTRNRLILYATVGRVDPGWVVRDAWAYAADLAKLVLLEDGRRAKVAAVLAGGWDALRGRRGPRPAGGG